MYLITKCTLEYIKYKIYSLLTLNKTAQRKQDCTKMHNKVRNEVNSL